MCTSLTLTTTKQINTLARTMDFTQYTAAMVCDSGTYYFFAITTLFYGKE